MQTVLTHEGGRASDAEDVRYGLRAFVGQRASDRNANDRVLGLWCSPIRLHRTRPAAHRAMQSKSVQFC